jgi:riboflavin-specific deaminase-like protein
MPRNNLALNFFRAVLSHHDALSYHGVMERCFDRGLPPGAVDPETAYMALGIPAGASRPTVVLTMIATLDGKAVVGGAGSTWAMGTEADHLLFKQIQRNCDAVIAGAGVMRVDDIPYPRISPEEAARRVACGLRPRPLWIVVSRSGRLSPDLRIFKADPADTWLVTTEAADPEALRALAGKTRIRAFGRDRLDVDALLWALRMEEGIHRLNSLGGPTLNGAMLEAGAIDELFLTLAPKIQNGRDGVTLFEGEAFPPERLALASLVSLYRSGDELYLRYRLDASPRLPHLDVTEDRHGHSLRHR